MTCPTFLVQRIIRLRSNRSKCRRTEKNAMVLRESGPLVDTPLDRYPDRAHHLRIYEWRLVS